MLKQAEFESLLQDYELHVSGYQYSENEEEFRIETEDDPSVGIFPLTICKYTNKNGNYKLKIYGENIDEIKDACQFDNDYTVDDFWNDIFKMCQFLMVTY